MFKSTSVINKGHEVHNWSFFESPKNVQKNIAIHAQADISHFGIIENHKKPLNNH